MSYPTTGNLSPSLCTLEQIAATSRKLREDAKRILDDIRPAIIGQRVRQYQRTWEICQVSIASSGDVICYGVTVSKRGKVGTRGFDLGRLQDCEFIGSGEHG